MRRFAPVIAAIVAVAVMSSDPVGAVISALSDKKGTVKVVQEPQALNVTSNSYADLPGMSTTIEVKEGALLIVRYSASSSCADDGDADVFCRGRVQIVLDNETVIGPQNASSIFIQTPSGVVEAFSLSIERAIDDVPKGVHTVKVQAMTEGDGDDLFLDSGQLTVQAFK